MTRYEELINIIPEDSIALVKPTVDEVINLERQLKDLKKLPFIQVNPNNPMQQKATPASKLYKEFLQQYINCIKMIEYVIYKDKRLDSEEAEESPLRKWFKDNASI